MATDLLEVESVDTYHGRSHTLQNISLNVKHGSIVALLGRNGAGKSTTVKSIMGINRVSHGSIRFDGQELRHLPPHRIVRLGISYVPEDRGIFPSLTVEENLSLNFRHRTNGRATNLAALYKDFPILADRRHKKGDELSGGEQQLLSIARAIALEPRLLILDEPTEGLAPIMIDLIYRMLRTLKSSGMDMLLVEQNYPFALALADQVYVLGKGRIRWRGTAPRLETNPEIKTTWLGV